MRALVLSASAVVLAVVVAACSGKAPCSAATCGTCCSAGECVAATSVQACGSAGNECVACGAGFACNLGVCMRTGAGGGAGGGSGGSGGNTAGGSTAGGSGGASGGNTAGGSAGGTAGGAVMCGTAPTAPTIPISFPATCPGFTACGGNPAGVFFYTSACIPQSEFDSFKDRIENGQGGVPGCGPGTVTVRGYDGGMAGYAFFDAGTVCRAVTGGVTVYSTISGFCAQAAVCNQINGNIMGYQASCFVDGGLCDCRVTRTIAINNAATYSTGPTTLTIGGSNQTFETCLTGGATMFATRELDAGTAEHEPGVAGLTKQ